MQDLFLFLIKIRCRYPYMVRIEFFFLLLFFLFFCFSYDSPFLTRICIFSFNFYCQIEHLSCICQEWNSLIFINKLVICFVRDFLMNSFLVVLDLDTPVCIQHVMTNHKIFPYTVFTYCSYVDIQYVLIMHCMFS